MLGLVAACVGGSDTRRQSPGAAVDAARKDSAALRIVQTYLQRDARELEFHSSPEFGEWIAWPQDPGYDRKTVVSGFSIGTPRWVGDTIHVPVCYDVLGVLWSGGQKDKRFEPGDTVYTVDFVLMKLDAKWQLARPQLEPHVLPATIDSVVSAIDRGAVDSVRRSHQRSVARADRLRIRKDLVRLIGIVTGALIFAVSLARSIDLHLSMNRHRIDLKPGLGLLNDFRRTLLSPENYSPEGQRLLRRFRLANHAMLIGGLIIMIFLVFVT